MLAALLISALLDVPYMAQPPDLCGGAAVAMVMRYWGARDVFPLDFAPLVNHAEAGIPTGALATSVRDRGWQAIVMSVTSDSGRTDIDTQLHAGRPLIALIAVGPRTYHYVVIVGLTSEDIVVHDPAVAPFRVMHWSEFDRAWAAADRWMMLMLPPATMKTSLPAATAETPPKNESSKSTVTPCTALVEHGVQLALDGAADDAERALVAATQLCPSDPAPLRELSGLRFSQRRWPEARQFATAAVRLDPEDTYAWQLIASSDYLSGHAMAALAEWNRAGEPRIDTIDIQGAVRTPQPVLLDASGLEPRALLTPSTLQRAERRLQELPAAAGARATYTPIDGGRATVNLFIDERPMFPHGWWALTNMGARALLYDEARLDVVNPLRAGDAESVMWRWTPGRPRVDIGIALPTPNHLPGVLTFGAGWEAQSYAAVSAEGHAVQRDSRRRSVLRIADWATGRWRWQAGAALDRFNERGYVAADGALDLRLLQDHIALSTNGSWWMPTSGGPDLKTASLFSAWRSTTDTTRVSLSGHAALTVASDEAPLALWPGAGTGQGRASLLRAHTLLHDGIIDGPAFGRRLAEGSLELARPWQLVPGGGLSFAVFADTARAWRRMPGLDTSPLYIDAGIGLRAHAPGQTGSVRIDLAWGLRGGGTTLSVGWSTGWPR